MSNKFKKALPRCGFAVVVLLTLACASVSVYDPTSYKNATDLKAQALLVVGEAVDPPSLHAQDIKDITLRLQQAVEYESGKGKPNTFTVQEWQKMADPKGGLLGEFLLKWQTDNAPEKPAVISGATENISQGFDQIIKLENYKVKN